jgi:hypothetical protein
MAAMGAGKQCPPVEMMIDPIAFPLLSRLNCAKTSEADPEYNCIAHAADDQSQYWWPDQDGDGYWPQGIARAETIEAFIAAFGAIGYIPDPSNDPSLDAGVEKVAIYALGDEPTHAAKQLSDGRWTSKLGAQEDISHDWGALDGPCYGRAVRVLRRETKPVPPPTIGGAP